MAHCRRANSTLFSSMARELCSERDAQARRWAKSEITYFFGFRAGSVQSSVYDEAISTEIARYLAVVIVM